MSAGTNYIPEVKAQYEELPYPDRDPSLERSRLYITIMDSLGMLNHYGFGGMQTYRNHFRALVAGGGTGDACINLAENLRHTNAEIVYLDMSSASMQISQQRAAVRGLTNITWVQDSLLNIPSLDLGTFDYINCSGVLHHLENPEAGLAALESVLKPKGVMGVMLYGAYGRTATYQVQALMKEVIDPSLPTREKIAMARSVLQALPENHILRRTVPDCHDGGRNLTDAEILDRFLHTQDRAYTIPQLYDFFDSANLQIIRNFGHMKHTQGTLLFSPKMYTNDPALIEKIAAMPARKRQAVCELMNSRITKHTVYVAREIPEIPSAKQDDMVPFLNAAYGNSSYKLMAEIVENADEVAVFVGANHMDNGEKLVLKKEAYTEAVMKNIDGNRSVGEIIHNVVQSHQADPEAVRAEIQRIANYFSIYSWMFFRHTSVPRFLSVGELTHQMKVATGMIHETEASEPETAEA